MLTTKLAFGPQGEEKEKKDEEETDPKIKTRNLVPCPGYFNWENEEHEKEGIFFWRNW